MPATFSRSLGGVAPKPSTCRGTTWKVTAAAAVFTKVLRRMLQLLYPHVAVADELPGVVAAAVDLQGDATGVRMPLLLVAPLHELHAVDPRGDLRRVAFDPRPQFVPLAVLPELRPFLRAHGQRERAGIGDDLRHLVLEVEVADADPAGQSLAVDAHQVSAAVVVDHRLVRLTAFGAPQEQAAVRAEVVLHLEDDFEVPVLLVGQDDPAVARLVLGAGDGAVFDDPAPARAVARLAADVPALQRPAVENALEAVGRGFGVGRLGAGRLSLLQRLDDRLRGLLGDELVARCVQMDAVTGENPALLVLRVVLLQMGEEGGAQVAHMHARVGRHFAADRGVFFEHRVEFV